MDSSNSYKKYFLKLLRSSIYTFVITIITLYGIYNLINSLYNTSSTVKASTFSFIISIFAGIVFTIIFSTITIVDEIKKLKETQI